MGKADELRKQIEEAKLRVADLSRTEYESLPAEEHEGYLAELAAAEALLEELESELASMKDD